MLFSSLTMMEQLFEVSSLEIFRKKVFLARLILLVLVVLVEMAGGFKVRYWNYLSPEETFQQVTVDRRTGTVFAAGRSTLLKLTGGTLVPLARYASGTAGPSSSGDEAKILEIDYASERLLCCGSVRSGLCSVFSLNDLSGGTLDPDNPANYLAGTGTVFAFFGTGSYLHVARTYYGQQLGLLSSKAITSSVLQVTASNLSYHLQSVAEFDFVSAAKTDYIVRYVYGFEHGEFVYFLTVQRQSMFAGDLAYETKLVRFCRNDTDRRKSYVELSLTCRAKASVATFFDVAQAAHVGRRRFAQRPGTPANEMVLYVLMGKSVQDGWSPEPSYGTGLCVFTMTDINADFTRAQTDCYQGYGSLLPWVTPEEKSCSRNVSSPPQAGA